MALTSSLFTGLSGLAVNQTRLNVVGNNIANVNTLAFKSSRVISTPQFYVTDSAGSPVTTDFGGQNPSQHGLGATVGSIQKDYSGGSLETTGRGTDLAIDGEGFFVLQGAERTYTRAGAFSLNQDQDLVNPSGNYVMGYGVDKTTGKVAVGTLQKLSIPLGAQTVAQATANVQFQGNLSTTSGGASVLNSQAITTVGGTTRPDSTTLLTDLADATANGTPLFAVGDTFSLTATKGTTAITPSTFTVSGTSTVQDLQDFYNSALSIDTTVTGGASQPKPGAVIKNDATPPAGDPYSIQFVVAGNLGSSNALTVSGGPLTLTNGTTGDPTPIASNPNGTQVKTQMSGYDSLGNPITLNITAQLSTMTASGTIWEFSATSPDNIGGPTTVVGSGTLQFDGTGKLVNATTPSATISRAGTGAVSPQVIVLDFSAATGLSDTNSQLKTTTQDGSPIGTLTSFSIAADGTITGTFSNDLHRTLGQVAVATFKNTGGLVDKGDNQYSASAASGVAIVGTPNQLGAGAVRAGSLEMSNVDLSTEFTNLIIASTGFSASSKVITTSDELIQNLLNSAR